MRFLKICCDLDLKHRNTIFSQDTLTYNLLLYQTKFACKRMTKSEIVILLLFDVMGDWCLYVPACVCVCVCVCKCVCMCVCVSVCERETEREREREGGELPVSGCLCAGVDVYVCRTLFSPSYICISPYVTYLW